MSFLIKTLVSALVVAAVSELSKRSTLLGGLLASLPLTSYLAFLWIYAETRDTAKIAVLSREILWLVAPSLIFFAVLPVLIVRWKWGFFPALAAATGLMMAGYMGLLKALGK